jgi:hypothetical protein
MSIKRITISVPEEVARRIKQAAGAAPVSAWVTRVIEDQLDDAELERQWRLFYDDVGPSRRDVQRATSMLARLTRAKPRGRKA